MASTIAISGLTEDQNAKLEAVQVGDLLLIQKMVQIASEDYDSGDDEDYDGEDDGDEDGADEENDDEDEDEGESDSESEEEEEGGDESDEQAESDDTGATEITVPPRIYVVSSITKDTAGVTTDIHVVHLQYSSTTSTAHSYQIYGKQVVHGHPTACTNDCQTTKIAEIVNESEFEIFAKPGGDQVRRVDSDVWLSNAHTRCIPGCISGFLPHGHNLQTMIANYIPPTAGNPLPQSYQAPLCPVCIGVSRLKDQQRLQAQLMNTGFIDMGLVVEFLGRVNQRRRELGYAFEQFDEREWGFGEFDDMLSDEDGDYDDQGGRWERWDEAMDPNSSFQNRPANAATIAALPRNIFEATVVSEDETANCGVCLDKFGEGAVLVELPCGHAHYHEECMEQWLKQSNTCPTCRHPLPEASAAEAGTDSAAEGAAGEDPSQVGMDGDDAVMSDV